MAVVTRYTELTGCRVPVQQAPMGSVSTTALAVAVAEAGGVGSISEGMQRLADQGLAFGLDIGDRFWIDIDDAAAFGRAEREAGQLMAIQ